jgi:hypothetical protein
VVIEENVKCNPKVQCCFCDREFVGGAGLQVYDIEF